MSIETRLEKLEGKSGLKDQPIAFFTWHDSSDDAALEAMQSKYADGLLFITYYEAKPICKFACNNDPLRGGFRFQI